MHSVLRFDPSGQLLSEWGPRLGEATLTEPAGVAVQGDNYYVVDRGTPRIFRLDADGPGAVRVDVEQFGTYGLNGLAVDTAGDMYVADTGRNRILVFGPDGSMLQAIGRPGADLGGFTQPMTLAFAPDGSFFVADWENSRIERWDATGQATDAWSTAFRPFGVDVDQLGRVYVPYSEQTPSRGLFGAGRAAGRPRRSGLAGDRHCTETGGGGAVRAADAVRPGQ